MKDEIEATFRNINKDDLRKRLKEVNALLIKPEFMQRRVVFNLPSNGDLVPEMPLIIEQELQGYIVYSDKKLQVNDVNSAKQMLEVILSEDTRTRENKGWLRVRDESSRITMTYKRQDSSQIDGMKEIEIVINDFDLGFKLLEFLGCKYKAYQETKRELWSLDDVEITIDEWPYLEPFAEIEGETQEKVKTVSTKLGFKWNLAYFGAVDGLYSEKYGVTEDKINNHTPEILFDKPNPFVKV